MWQATCIDTLPEEQLKESGRQRVWTRCLGRRHLLLVEFGRGGLCLSREVRDHIDVHGHRHMWWQCLWHRWGDVVHDGIAVMGGRPHARCGCGGDSVSQPKWGWLQYDVGARGLPELNYLASSSLRWPTSSEPQRHTSGSDPLWVAPSWSRPTGPIFLGPGRCPSRGPVRTGPLACREQPACSTSRHPGQLGSVDLARPHISPEVSWTGCLTTAGSNAGHLPAGTLPRGRVGVAQPGGCDARDGWPCAGPMYGPQVAQSAPPARTPGISWIPGRILCTTPGSGERYA